MPRAVYNNGKLVEKDTFSFSSWLATANQTDAAEGLEVQQHSILWAALLHLCLELDMTVPWQHQNLHGVWMRPQASRSLSV